MVNKINVKLLFITVGLVISMVGIYMNTITTIDWTEQKLIKIVDEEVVAFLVAIGIALSLTGVVIPIQSEQRPTLMGTPQGYEVGESQYARARMAEVEFLCPKCGTPITSNMIYCTNCGRRVRSE
ncbi:MAG: zinc ribbon domain-containing protein [Thermoproteota archaeon]